MISIGLAGGRAAFTPFLNALQLCTIAVSLGDSSTLVWPWPAGNLVRISTGLEDFDDLGRGLFGSARRRVSAAAAD